MRIGRHALTVAGVLLALLLAYAVAGSGGPTAAQPVGPQVTTLAGSGATGVVDGPAATAQFDYPVGLAVDGAGVAYVVDGNRIRRVSPSGAVLSLAGGEEAGFVDGPAADARFSSPRGIAVDQAGTLYIADRDNHRIRTLSPQGLVATLAGSGTPGFADGPGKQAQFNEPHDVAVDAAGTVYVLDTFNYRIRRISLAGVVSTLAGGGEVGPDQGDFADGPAAVARFAFATGIAVDAAGTVYVADTYNARIRAVAPSGEVRTVAGTGEDGGADGPADQAQFSDPAALAVDGMGQLYVVDKSNRLRLISPTGQVTTLAGSGARGFADGPAGAAQFDEPAGVAVGATGTVYIADTGNRRIRLLLPAAQ
jgi:sugar lactone lactonase YvrE